MLSAGADSSNPVGWTTSVCAADSDGDNFTNGDELGDSCCSWNYGDAPSWADGISHPALATSTPLGRASCSATPPAAITGLSQAADGLGQLYAGVALAWTAPVSSLSEGP